MGDLGGYSRNFFLTLLIGIQFFLFFSANNYDNEQTKYNSPEVIHRWNQNEIPHSILKNSKAFS